MSENPDTKTLGTDLGGTKMLIAKEATPRSQVGGCHEKDRYPDQRW